MADINVDSDLEQVNKQLETLVSQLNAVNTQRDQLTQQIHNLNGIAMYLRGKLPPVDAPVEVSDNNVSEKAKLPKDS